MTDELKFLGGWSAGIPASWYCTVMPVRFLVPVKNTVFTVVNGMYVVPPAIVPEPLPLDVRFTDKTKLPFHVPGASRALIVHAPPPVPVTSKVVCPVALLYWLLRTVPAPATKSDALTVLVQLPLLATVAG